jgi:hypothetical protein
MQGKENIPSSKTTTTPDKPAVPTRRGSKDPSKGPKKPPVKVKRATKATRKPKSHLKVKKGTVLGKLREALL